MEKYFDAHLYFANWGTLRLMLRVPSKTVDVRALRGYFVGDRLKKVGPFITLDFWSDDQERDEDLDEAGSLAVLAPLRDLILQGDLRPAFLSWLASVQRGEVEPSELMPSAPDGLGSLNPALEELVELLRLDRDLLSVVTEHSPPLGAGTSRRAWSSMAAVAGRASLSGGSAASLVQRRVNIGQPLLARSRRTLPVSASASRSKYLLAT